MDDRDEPQGTQQRYLDDDRPVDEGRDEDYRGDGDREGIRAEPDGYREVYREDPAGPPGGAPGGRPQAATRAWAADGFDGIDGRPTAESLRAQRADAARSREVLEGRLRKAMFGGLAFGGVLLVLRLVSFVFGGSPAPQASPASTPAINPPAVSTPGADAQAQGAPAPTAAAAPLPGAQGTLGAQPGTQGTPAAQTGQAGQVAPGT